MRLLSHTEHAADLKLIGNSFPFPFQQNYAAFARARGASLYVLSDGNALAPVWLAKSRFLTTLQFLFKPLGADAKELHPDGERRFLEDAIAYITSRRIAHRIVQPANFALFSAVPYGSTYAAYGSYALQLCRPNEEALLQGMQARYRTAIRAAAKLEPLIRTGAGELAAFWELHQATMQRTHMYYEQLDELEALVEKAGDNILVANCYVDGILQGGVLIAWSGYGAYYLHGASGSTPASDGAIKYLHYWCMCHLKRQGAERYDFVGARLSDVTGTKLEGIQNFKRRFGSELQRGFLWKKDISPFVCRVYDSLLFLKLALKGAKVPRDIIDQENTK